jgi:hypothetical protein
MAVFPGASVAGQARARLLDRAPGSCGAAWHDHCNGVVVEDTTMATQSDREIDWDVARLSGGLSASRRAEPAHQGSLRPSDWDLAASDEEPLSERSEAVARDLASLSARRRPIIESLAPMALEAAIAPPIEPEASPAAPVRRSRASRAENAFWMAAAGGMSVLAIGLVGLLAVAPAPHKATPAIAAPAAPQLVVVPEGLPVAPPRPVVNLDPINVKADAPSVAAAPIERPARAIVAASPAAIPPQMVIPPPAATAPIAGVELSRPAAAVAISVAGRRAASCLDANDPRGTMPVSVTFAPSGRVTTATVDGGPFVGTAVGGCIARALRSATVGPFDGAPVTVHSSVGLR